MSLSYIRYGICSSIYPVVQCFNLVKPSGNHMCHVLPTRYFCVLLSVLTVNNGYFREEHRLVMVGQYNGHGLCCVRGTYELRFCVSFR